MAERYHFAYGPETPYARVVGLVGRHRAAGGEVVLDIGCGFGAIAEPVREMGLTYIGVDAERDGLADLAGRGFEAFQVDLSDSSGALQAVGERLAVRRLAAVCALDFLEHLPDGEELLLGLRRLSLDHGPAPLVLSVPNVTHFDLAAKLLLGRWDVTPTGLLDSGHVSLYSSARLDEVTRRCGWAEVERDDFELAESDQHFPAGVPTLAAGAPLRELLFDVRSRSGSALVNQFVRAYEAANLQEPSAGAPSPFLSVVVPAKGVNGPAVEETLCSLAAQTEQDFEVLLLAPGASDDDLARLAAAVATFDGGFASRVSIVDDAESSCGQYVCVLEEEAVLFAHHVEVLTGLAAASPGRLLRSMVAVQAGAVPPQVVSPAHFDVVDQLANFGRHGGGVVPGAAACGFAFPRPVFPGPDFPRPGYARSGGLGDAALLAASWCGVAESGEVTVLCRRTPEPAGAAGEGAPGGLSGRPLLLPAGAAERIAALGAAAREADRLRSALAGAEREVAELRASTSWRITTPVRALSGAARRVLRPG